MCIKSKWSNFTPTDEYLSVVSKLTSVDKLYNYSQKFRYIAEKKDYWKTPVEFMNDGGGDCEDWARWYVDILVRVQKIEARFVIHTGYNKERWGSEIWNTKSHAICVFPHNGKLALFSNYEFKTRYKDYIETGYFTFPDGLKYLEIRNWQGKVLSRKFKLFKVF